MNTRQELTKYVYDNIPNCECPICGGWFETNGTGPDSMPKVRWLLRVLVPWDKVLNKVAVPVHDFRFHIGEHEINYTFEEINAEFKHNVQVAMDEYIAKRPIRRFLFNKLIYEQIDEIYKFFVSGSSGRKAFDKNGCLNAGGIG